MGLGFDPSFQRELARESWALYGVGMGFITLRIFARWHRVGFRHFYVDDWLMLLVAAWYTMLVVLLNVIVKGGGSNLFPPEQLKAFTEADIQERIKGSKLVIVSEQAMLNVIYTIKTCMLIFYSRLTTGLKQAFFLKIIAVYVACGWTATELSFFLACRPFYGYWAVPPPNPQCTTLEHYAITQATFNISSDILMLVIMLPLFMNLTLPWRQKLSLIFVFGLGSFVIVAALLNKIFNLTDVYSTVYMLWYVREASTAVYVSNIPMIWPLLREWFPYLSKLTPGHAIYAPYYNPRRLKGGESDLPSSPGSSPADTKSGSGTDGKGHVLHDLRRMGRGMSVAGIGKGIGMDKERDTEETRPESTLPITRKGEAASVLDEGGVDVDVDDDSIKDLEMGVFSRPRRGGTGRSRKRIEMDEQEGKHEQVKVAAAGDDLFDFMASIQASNGNGRLHGQSYERSK